MSSRQEKSFQSVVDRLLRSAKKRKPYVMALSRIVVFITTYVLILPAITLEQDEAAKQGGIDLPTQTEQTEQTEQAEQKDNLSYEGKGYEVSVRSDGETLPEGTRIEVEEISKSDDSYKTLQEDALQAVRKDNGKN